ncbi:MAG TPA: hypothetical protein VHU80_16870 [Polyangiaceae bacterium]|jgi:hypothetical protein|nr:hypothetical protein [Polyangiaceae bacterium]
MSTYAERRDRDYPGRREAKAPVARGPKIIVQYRAKGAKVYELQSNDVVVAVRICQEEGETVEGGWRVDAQSGPGSDSSVIEGWGATAAEALNEMARAWKAHCPALTGFDWDAIARELHVVHAL